MLVPENGFVSEISKIHDVDYQMSLIFSQDDPLNILKNAVFTC